ncbi:DUF1279 domain-containing protein, partial [archaeon]
MRTASASLHARCSARAPVAAAQERNPPLHSTYSARVPSFARLGILVPPALPLFRRARPRRSVLSMSFSSILLLRGQRVAGVLPMSHVAVATRRWSPAAVLLPYRACSSSSSRATASTGAGPAAASPSAASPPAAQVHDMSDIKFAVRHPVAWWRANSAKLKDMFKRYGYFAVGTYLGVYVLTLAGMYGLVSTGVIAGPDVNEWLNNWSVKKALSAEPVHLSQRFQNFAMAWIMT